MRRSPSVLQSKYVHTHKYVPSKLIPSGRDPDFDSLSSSLSLPLPLSASRSLSPPLPLPLPLTLSPSLSLTYPRSLSPSFSLFLSLSILLISPYFPRSLSLPPFFFLFISPSLSRACKVRCRIHSELGSRCKVSGSYISSIWNPDDMFSYMITHIWWWFIHVSYV